MRDLHCTPTPSTPTSLGQPPTSARICGPVLTVSIILLIVPIGLGAWRGECGLLTTQLALAWFTFVFAVEQVSRSRRSTLTVFGKRGFIAPGGPMNFTLGAGLFLVWVISAGVAASSVPLSVEEPEQSARP